MKNLIFFALMLVAISCVCSKKASLSTPKNLQLKSKSNAITWRKVKNAEGYKVQIQNIDDKLSILEEHSKLGQAKCFYSLKDLATGVHFEIRVVAFNIQGESPPSETVSYFVKMATLNTPKGFQLKSKSNAISWRKVNNADGYKVQIQNIDDKLSILEEHSVFGKGKCFYSLNDMPYDIHFEIRVVAFNAKSQSLPSEPVSYFIEMEKPLVKFQKKSYIEGLGGDVKITAKIENGADEIKWFYNGVIVKESDRITIVTDNNIASLAISNLSTEDNGRYKVSATNIKGLTEQEVSLNVVWKPRKPEFRILDVGNDFIYVYIKGKEKGNILSRTIIELYDENLDVTKTVSLKNAKHKYQLVKDLNFGHAYTIQAYFENSFGKGDPVSHKISLMTDAKDIEVPNCRKAKMLNPRHCDLCADGFSKIKKKRDGCLECPTSNCKKCSGTTLGVCVQCLDGYYLSNGECKATATEHCAEGNDEYCSYCQVGFYKTFDGKCAQCGHANCDLCYGPDEKCSYCEKGYALQKDGSCGKTNCGTSENCAVCIDETCHRCDYGYYIKDDSCEGCSTLVKNCRNCNSKAKKCVECESNYRLSTDGLSCELKETRSGTPSEHFLEKRDVGENAFADDDFDDEEDEDSYNPMDYEFGEDEDEYDEDEYEDAEDTETAEDVEGEGDPELFEPKDSWGFDVLKSNTTYYLEAEVQLHVSHNIYAFYMAQFKNDHTRALSWIRKKFIAGYNFLGWALNRLIVDDIGEDKFFMTLIPWELMVYVDNGALPMAVYPKSDSRSTSPANYVMKKLGSTWKPFMQNIYQTNGAIADMHMYFSKAGFHGAVVGVAIKKVWFGLAIGMDKAGSVVGHELGHTIGMPDAYIPEGNAGKLNSTQKYGIPGSYYSKYRTIRIKNRVTDQSAFYETICSPTDLVDGRRIGRIPVNQPFYHAYNNTRDGICKYYAGDNCVAKKSNSCKDLACLCTNEFGDVTTKKFKTMIRGLKCGENKVCYDKKCASESMMKWNGAYTVDNTVCRYKNTQEIIDKEIVPNYKCLDTIDNTCVFGRKDWIIGDKNPFTI